MTIKTRAALLAEKPITKLRAAKEGYDPLWGPQYHPFVEDMHDTLLAELDTRGRSRVLSDLLTSFKTSNGATLTVAAYQLDMTKGIVLLDGKVKAISAWNDKSICGAGAVAESIDLNGASPALLTADGKTRMVVLLAVLVSSVPTLYAVSGAEAADTEEITPTDARIVYALTAAAVAGMDVTKFVKLGTIKIQRTAVDTIVATHSDPETSATVLDWRVNAYRAGIG